MAVAEVLVVGMEAAEFTAVGITVGTMEAGITADITVAGMAAITADIGAVHGGRGGDSLAQRAQRYTTVPMLLITTAIRTITAIRIMRIHQRPSTDTTLRQHLRPSVTLQWLTKMEG